MTHKPIGADDTTGELPGVVETRIQGWIDAGDAGVQANLTQEITDREAADTVLQDNIDAEATVRSAADNALNTRVTETEQQLEHGTELRAKTPIAGSQPRLVVNELSNPALLVSDSGWTAASFGTGGTGTAVRTADQGPNGTGDFGYVVTFTGAPSGGGANFGPTADRVSVVAGDVLYGSIYVKSSIGFDISVTIGWYDAASGGSLISQDSTVYTVAANTWTRLYSDVAKTAPATALSAAVYVRVLNLNGFGTNTLRIGRAMLTRGRNLTPYRDIVNTTSARAGFGVAYGDSLTQNAHGGGTDYAAHLATVVGQPVINQGRGGEPATGIGIRQGGVQPVVTVSGNQIPISGSVAVTVDPTTYYTTTATWNFYGSIAGVPGLLSRAISTGLWTFTRTASGSAVDVLASGVPFRVFNTQDLADFSVIWAGVNDIDNGTIEGVLNAVGAMVARCRATGQPFIVQGLINNSGSGTGTPALAFVKEANAALEDAYGDSYLDVRTWLMTYGLVTAGITPTAQDIAAVADERIPPSLLYTDGIHLNEDGRTALSKFVGDYIKAHILTPVATPVPVTNYGPALVVPPLTVNNPAAAAWPAANRALFHRFQIVIPTKIRYLNWIVGTQAGNVQVGVIALSGSGHTTGTLVGSTGIIACPAPGNIASDLGEVTLPPGDYAAFCWSDSTAFFTRFGSSGSIPGYHLANQVSSLTTGVGSTVNVAAWNLNQAYFACTLSLDM